LYEKRTNPLAGLFTTFPNSESSNLFFAEPGRFKSNPISDSGKHEKTNMLGSDRLFCCLSANWLAARENAGCSSGRAHHARQKPPHAIGKARAIAVIVITHDSFSTLVTAEGS
jgi:hypothetical protein